MSPLSTYLRTRRFNGPTFGLTRHTNLWKNTAFRDFSNIWRGRIFFLLTFWLLHLLSTDLITLLLLFNSPYCRKFLFKLPSATPHNKVILQCYSVLQSTTPVLLRTTKYYSSTTPYYKILLQYYSNTTLYYKVLLQYYSVLQSTTPRRQNDVLPVYYSVLRQYYKSFQNEPFVRGFRNFFTKKASKIHRTSFQNERFARCFRQFSQKKLPKGSFRARLPPNFTEEASKTSVSRDASS